MSHSPSGARSFTIPTVAVILVGLAIGYFCTSSPPSDSSAAPTETKTPAAIADTTRHTNSPTTDHSLFSISLSDFDLRDRLQQPKLTCDNTGAAWLVWESQTAENERTVFLSRSVDNGASFSSPTPVRRTAIYQWDAMIRGKAAKRSSRMWPSVAWTGERLLLSWVESDSEDSSQQTLMYAESTDSGHTFGAAKPLSTESAVRPTFVGFAANETTIASAWLDHRNHAQQPFAGMASTVAADQLVYAGPDGKGICPCCHLNVQVTDDGGTLVAFRNSQNGYRDMFIAYRRPDDADFSAPIPVVSPTWQFKGCPHDGPSMVVVEDTVHIVWMDAHSGIPQVYYGRGTRGGWKFKVRPIHPSPSAQGHASISAAAGVLRVIWKEAGHKLAEPPSQQHSHGGGASSSVIHMMTSDDHGQSFGRPVRISKEDGAFNTRPVLVKTETAVVTAWTSISEQGKKLVVRAEPTP